jgi:hypothetical protein
MSESFVKSQVPDNRVSSLPACGYCGKIVVLPPGPQPVPPLICGGDECRKKRAEFLQQVG